MSEKGIRRAACVLACLPVMPCLAQQEGQVEPIGSYPVADDAQTADRAADTERPAESQRTTSRIVEEIIVTAQKREENLRDVPISVSAFSAGKLEALGVEEISNLQSVTPGLTITRTGAADVVYLRGVGTDAFLPGVDPSVPYYIDGVLLLSGQGTSTFLDHIERVEVLKGPQGTLFGASSVGGAINVVTADPKQEFSSDVTLGYGNYDAFSIKAYTNLPLTENLATSVSLFSTRQDNFANNSVGGTVGVYARGGRAKVRWNIASNLSNTFSASYQEISDNVGLAWNNTRPAPVLSAILPAASGDSFEISNNSAGGSRATSYVIANTLNWELQYIDVKLVGSAQKQRPLASADFDGTRIPVSKFTGERQSFGQYTAELQFNSNDETPFHDRLTWVGGFFYNYVDGGFDPLAIAIAPNLLGGLAGPLGSQLSNLLNPITSLVTGIDLNRGVVLYSHGILKGDAISAYWQGTLHLSETLKLLAGGRYQYSKRDLKESRTEIDNPEVIGGRTTLFSPEVPTLTAKQFSPRLSLQWYPFDDGTQIYTSWARGFKTPTYNTVNLLGTIFGPIEPVKAQRNDAYEIGIKTQLFDDSLQLNAAAFYTKQKNLLNGFIAVLTGGVVAYNNVPEATIKGAEFDAVWTPLPVLNPGMAVTLSAAYLDAEYTDFPNGQGFDEVTGLAFGPGKPFPPLPQQDFSGNDIVRTPKLSYNASISQTIDFDDSTLELSVNGNYSSGFYFLPQNSALYEVDSFVVLNAHATYMYNPWGLEGTLYCQNLADTMYTEAMFVDDFGRTTMPNAPRTYGVRVKWTF